MQNRIKLVTNFICFIFLAFFPLSSLAVCPVCAVVVGVGVGFSRWLGVDDTITGIWVGGFIVSLICWTISWFNKINFHFYGRKILTIAAYYVLTIWPLYHWNIMGVPENKIHGIDRLLFGIIVGTITFFFSYVWYNHMKKHNNGHSYFRGQKVVMPAVILIVSSLVMYCLIK